MHTNIKENKGLSTVEIIFKMKSICDNINKSKTYALFFSLLPLYV